VTRIVCQVSDKPARITFVWSAGAATFEPIHIEAGELSDLRNVAAAIRQRLAAGQEAGDLDGRLFAQLFPGPLGAEIAGWLRDLDGRGEIESLEVASDAPGEIPWSAVDDPQKPGAWGRRFAISGGHRVHPLRSFPDVVEPKLLAVLHPSLEPALADEVMASLSARQAPIVHTREELLARLQSELPDLLWIVAPADDAGWRLDQGVLTAEDLARALAKKVAGNPYPLVVSSAFGETNISALREALPGLVTSEVALAEGPAVALGRAFLAAFLDERRPLGAALRQVRDKVPGPAALAWTAYAPPQVGVRTAADVSAAPTPTIHPLPAEPFHPLRPLEREDRALLLGREDDILACAAMLDRADASALWIHGKASVGKASLLRAGLIPFLEEETGGFVAWRERTAAAGPETEAKLPTLSARVGRDACGSIAQGLLAFCAKPLQFVTPTGRTVVVDLPGLLGEFAPIVSSAIREGAEPAPIPVAEGPPPSPPADPTPAEKTIAPDAIRIFWTRLNSDPAILERILERITRPLPFELVLAFEQGDDLVALPSVDAIDSSADRRAVAGRLLDVLGRTSARVKSVVTVRTEFFAQVQDVMHDASARQAWQDHFLPELDEQALRDVLHAPSAGEPLPYSNQVPATKYAFGIEPAVVDDLLSKIGKVARGGHVGRLSLVQAVGAELADLSRRRSLSVIRPADVKKYAVEKAMPNLIRGKLRTAVRGVSRGIQSLFERLMVKHDSGIRTRNLLSQRSLQEKWKESQPFKQVVDRLYDAGLIDLQVMAQDGAESRYIGPPQDSFEPLDVDRETDVSRKTYARSRVVDTLFVMIPLALLGMALTYWYVNRQYRDYLNPNSRRFKELLEDIEAKDISLRLTRLAAYHGTISRADQALELGDTLRARQLLLSLNPDPPSELRSDGADADLRGFEWFLLWRKMQMEMKKLYGHTAGVGALAVSDNGELLATGDNLGKVILWSVGKGEQGATLVGLKQPIASLAISADGAWVAGCDGGREVFLWPTTIGNEEPVETVPKARADVKNARAVAFAGPGILAIAADDGVILWDVAAGKERATIKDAGRVLALAPLPDGKFATATADEAILWSSAGKKESAVKLKDATILGIAAGPSSLLIAGSNHSEGVVYSWDLKDGSTPALKAKQAEPIRAVAALSEGRIATAGEDMTIRIHDLAAGKELARLYGHISQIRGLVAGKGDLLVSSGSDPAVRLWNGGPITPLRESVPAHDSVEALALNETGQLLASGGHDGLIKLWNPLTTAMTGEIKAGGPVAALAFAPKGDDKSTVLTAAVGNDIRRWTLTAGKSGFDAKELPPLKKHSDRVLCLRFTRDGKMLASGGRDKTAIVWDVTGEKALQVLANPAVVTAIDFPSPYVVAGDETGTVRIWEAETGRPLDPFRPHGLAITGLDVIRYQGLSVFVTSSLDQTFRTSVQGAGHAGVETASSQRGFAEPVTAFVQGANFQALAGGGGSVAIVDVSISEPRFVFRAHPGRINTMVLAQRQAVLITGGADGTLRFFQSEPRPEYGPVMTRIYPRTQAAGDEEP
jgi:WD40 repeat protein